MDAPRQCSVRTLRCTSCTQRLEAAAVKSVRNFLHRFHGRCRLPSIVFVLASVAMQAPAAPAPTKPDVLVLGCGISGLSCGILLARLGHRVTIWAKELPPHTTSNAGAHTKGMPLLA